MVALIVMMFESRFWQKKIRWLKFFYLTSVPAHEDLQWPRLEPTADEFASCMGNGGRQVLNNEPRKGKIHHVPKGFLLPKTLNFKVSNLKKVDRSAGTAANQKAAAASAWVLSNAHSNFVNGPMVWTGAAVGDVKD